MEHHKMKQAALADMDMAHRMHSRWCSLADDHVRERWYKTHLIFWHKDKPMATLRWAPFDLDVVSFEIPQEWPGDEAVDLWTCHQPLMLGDTNGGEPAIVSSKQAPNGTPATVCEVVDAFLEGLWTPYWHCASCRRRFNGNLKPL